LADQKEQSLKKQGWKMTEQMEGLENAAPVK